MNEYIKVFIIIFLLWCVYTYFIKSGCNSNCGCNREGFIPNVVKWTGRDVPFKQCINNCDGLRHHNFRDCAANCNQNDEFRKHYYLA